MSSSCRFGRQFLSTFFQLKVILPHGPQFPSLLVLIQRFNLLGHRRHCFSLFLRGRKLRFVARQKRRLPSLRHFPTFFDVATEKPIPPPPPPVYSLYVSGMSRVIVDNSSVSRGMNDMRTYFPIEQPPALKSTTH